MSKKIRIASFVAAALFSLTALTACSAPADDKTNGNTSSVVEDKPNMDGDVQLSEPGEFPIVIGDPVELSIFTAYGLEECKDFSSANNATTQFIEKQDNVKLTFTTVSRADKTAKLNLLFQSNAYEDMIFYTQWDAATQYAYGSQGYLIDLTKYVEEDAYYYTKMIDSMIEQGFNEKVHWDALKMPNGETYSMGTPNGTSHTQHTTRMWIYQPWLDQLKLDMPTTTDEFYDVLVAMKEGDPNGNGKADEVPLSGSPTGWNTDPFRFLVNSFVYFNGTDYTYVDNGEIKMSYMQDGFKDALVYYNKLVEDGLLMTDSFTQDVATLKTLTTADLDRRIVGVAPGGMQSTISNMVNYEQGEWTNWVSVAPLEGPDGVQFSLLNSIYATAAGHITNNCEHPKTAFRVMDSFYESATGLTIYAGAEGEFWDYVEPGDFLGERGNDATFTRHSQGENGEINYAWGSTSAPYSLGEYWEWPVQGNPDFNQGVLLYRAAAQHSEFAPTADMIMPPLIFNEDDAKDVTDYKTTIATYLTESIVNFAVNGGIEEGWDAFKQRMNDMGTEELLELYQAAYDERLAAMG